MLYFVSFNDGVVPMLVDAASEEEARVMVVAVAEREPAKLKPIACGVFAAELFTEDEDGHELVCAPLDEIVELLEALDEEDEPSSGVDAVVCGDESEYEGEVIVCTLPSHEDGDHSGTSSAGESVTW
jgi:hypothetical protein